MNIQTPASSYDVQKDADAALGPTGELIAPFRAPYTDDEEMRRIGAALGRAEQVELAGFEPFDFKLRERDNERTIEACYRASIEAVRDQLPITPAAEWLLDNHHLVIENIRQVRRDLPEKFYRQLPTVAVAGTDAHVPRAIALAWTYVARINSSFSVESLTAVVEGFQQSKTLKIGEIWAVPALLRFLLLENLRRASARVQYARHLRIEANEFADKVLAAPEDEVQSILSGAGDKVEEFSFSLQLLYRLRDGSRRAQTVLAWLETMLERSGTDAEEVMHTQHHRLSSANAIVGNIVRSLRAIDDVDWTKWFEDVSVVDRMLRARSDFGQLDPKTRNRYRDRIEVLARRSETSETEVTEKALALADAGLSKRDPHIVGNVGHYIVGEGRDILREEVGYRPMLRERARRSFQSMGWYGIAAPVALFTAILLVIAADALDPAGFAAATLLLVLIAIPASEAAMGLFNTLSSYVVRPYQMPGYDFEAGIPASSRTLVVMPCLISDRDTVDELVRNLEVHYLSNPGGETYFALLSDWPDAAYERSTADDEILAYAQKAVDEIAVRYAHTGGRRFYLIHRERTYNEADGVWMGWERKRGKLEELFDLLRGETHTSHIVEAHQLPQDVAFVMTLDSDTRLPRDTVAELVGKMAHPLNAPQNDPETGRVTTGYAILQPRITPSLTTGEEASTFQRIFSANRGLDPYTFAVSDTYQDLFGEGSFTGKGLIHIDAFRRALRGRIADNRVLSHDLLEGGFARAALVSDVEFVEDFPTRYDVETSRQHRWTRGDWQLLSYLFGREGRDLTPLYRFKIVDNLRRSLLPLSWVLASLAGWLLLPAVGALGWQAALIAFLIISPAISLLKGFFSPQIGVSLRSHLIMHGAELTTIALQGALRIVLMAHSAWVLSDAAVRALHRRYVSGRNLLEWRTAASVHRSSSNSLSGYYRSMWSSVAIGVAALLLTLLSGSSGIVVALPICLAWIAAPAIARQVSRSAIDSERVSLNDSERAYLRRIGRRTWRYFEAHVTAEHHDLPPDNFQEDPQPVTASRTSPTNIGLYLISTVSARDLGWIGFHEMLGRIERTLETLGRMERWNGHFYNWYDTTTLLPMDPRYVSAVDSGNLAGHLIVVASALRECAGAPAAYLHGDLHGIRDTADILEEILHAIPDDRRSIRPLRRRISERIGSFRAALERGDATASVQATGLIGVANELQRLSIDLDLEIDSHDSRRLVRWSGALIRVCEAHADDPTTDRTQIAALTARLLRASEQARAFAFEMDFRSLYNEDRRLLSIGMRVDTGEMDDSCYDLLASEARLTSLFAIAKGDLPREHWFRLGRPVTSERGRGALVSWSGSMFEYLMPPLVMDERVGGILAQSGRLAVDIQRRYGRQLGHPWGISEAAFNARDHNLTYQYSNFGIPKLGLKRDLGHNAVIAPYASALAVQVAPKDAIANLRRLASIGALGAYGYYESIDFTPTRLRTGQKQAIIRAYFAHHQGMSICALANAVTGGRLRELFHADPVIEAAELLLQEKAPRLVVSVSRAEQASQSRAPAGELERPVIDVVNQPLSSERRVHLLSNGHYSLVLSATGAGISRWNGLAVTRWRPAPVEDNWGQFLFVRDLSDGQWWSASAAPRVAPEEHAEAIFSDHKAEFSKTVGTISTHMEIIVAGEADAEARRLTVSNSGEEEKLIEITSYAELVLSSEEADHAHPVFSKMFVRTEIDAKGDAIYAQRNKRTLNEPDFHVAHLVTETSSIGRGTEVETDRRAFIGRGRTISNARAFDEGATLSGSAGFTMDPIMSLRRVLRVPAGKSVSITYWTIASPSRELLEQRVAHYRHQETFEQESQIAWTRGQVRLRHIGIGSKEAQAFQRLSGFLVYPDRELAMQASSVRSLLQPQSHLWPLGISGDYPIFVLRTDSESDLEIVQEALAMSEYIRAQGLVFDLVILNERATSYVQDMQQAIDIACETARNRGRSDGPREHIFTVRRDLAEAGHLDALLGAARIVLHTRNGRLTEQLDRLRELRAESALSGGGAGLLSREGAVSSGRRRRWHHRRPEPIQPDISIADPDGSDLTFWNGYGGFDPQSGDYVVRVKPGESTPHPWINVISGENFGFHVSAGGAAFTWSVNSRDYQLTPWSNDTVINRPGEALYVRDLDSGKVVTPFSALGGVVDEPYEARHGQGVSSFRSAGQDLVLTATMALAEGETAKITRLRIDNRSESRRRLRLYAYAEWVLGNNENKTGPFILPSHDREAGVLSASNPFSTDYAGRHAFLALSEKTVNVASSRLEFIGRRGTVFHPQAVAEGKALSDTIEIGGDPCAALSCDIEIAAGESREILVILGDTDSQAEAGAITERLRARAFDDHVAAAKARWSDFLGTLQIDTPDEAMNLMVNRWLPYQALACRVRARSAFYQASGAYGFRDQLQDTSALLLQDPSLARDQILNAASRQFPEGDVQHWWLPGSGAGVRTMISDDVVWLGYLTAHYVSVTGDEALLDHTLPFIDGPKLEEGQHDAFFPPHTLEESATLYEHCARALDLGCSRAGQNGLPLILGGDWNDGMNRVGEEGRGTSVWLGWFMAAGLSAMLPIAERRGDNRRASNWSARLGQLRDALQHAGWDGAWYKRGTFDDGTALGSRTSDECRIDTIAQSWSVLSGHGDPARSSQAMDNVLEILADEEVKIIKLFTPAFQHSAHNPGYIKGYPPGVRENGGQYTHGAIWSAYALAELGRHDDAWRVYSMLLPINHALDRQNADLYRVEPYVVAADIYGEEDRRGRGGWTWYTGSAGWLYRTSVEAILGIRRAGNRLHVTPRLPSHWDGYSAVLRQESRSFDIAVTRAAAGGWSVAVNGEPSRAEDGSFPLDGGASVEAGPAR